jgi:hypothetical protein
MDIIISVLGMGFIYFVVTVTDIACKAATATSLAEVLAALFPAI